MSKDNLKLGQRCRLNQLGRERSPRLSHGLGTVVGVDRSSIRVIFDGRKSITSLHKTYVEGAEEGDEAL